MLYVVIGWEAAQGSARRPAVREHHLRRLADLQSPGRLCLKGRTSIRSKTPVVK